MKRAFLRLEFYDSGLNKKSGYCDIYRNECAMATTTTLRWLEQKHSSASATENSFCGVFQLDVDVLHARKCLWSIWRNGEGRKGNRVYRFFGLKTAEHAPGINLKIVGAEQTELTVIGKSIKKIVSELLRRLHSLVFDSSQLHSFGLFL